MREFKSLDTWVFLGFWLLIICLKKSIIGSHYLYELNDSALATFSLGINWITLEPKLIWALPAPVSNLVSGLIMSLVSVDKSETSLSQFFLFGTIAQGFVVFMSGICFAKVANLLSLRHSTRIVLIGGVFFLPWMLEFVGYWGHYFELGIVSLPIGLAIFAALRGETKAYFAAGVGCGILVGSNYPSLGVFLPLVVVLLWRDSPRPLLGLQYLTRPHWSEIKEHCNFVFLLSVATVIAPLLFCVWYLYADINPSGRLQSNPVAGLILVTLILVGATTLISFFFLLLFRSIPVCEALFSGFLIGFLLVNLFLLPWYGPGLLSILQSQTTAAVDSSNTLLILSDLPILSILLILIAGSAFAIGPTKWAITGGLRFVIFLLSSLGLLLVGLSPAIDPSDPSTGLGLRQLVAVVPLWLLGIVVLLEHRVAVVRYFGTGAVIATAVFLGHDYFTYQSQAVEKQQLIGAHLDEVVADFSKTNPQGVIVCLRNEYPTSPCITGYAYNRYRTMTSTSKFPSRMLMNDSVLWVWSADSEAYLQQLVEPLNSPLLIIGQESFKQDFLRALCFVKPSCLEQATFDNFGISVTLVTTESN